MDILESVSHRSNDGADEPDDEKHGFFTVTIECEVIDDEELYQAAMKRAKDEGLSGEELRDEEGVDRGACLQMLLDPGYIPDAGFSILESSAEAS